MREIYPPTAAGVGDDRAFLFLFALFDGETGQPDEENLAGERAAIEDDAVTLAAHGYRVIIDTAADFQTLTSALYGTDPDLASCRPAGMLWSSHGSPDGQIQACDGSWISHERIQTPRVSRDLEMVIFSACHIGRWEPYWMSALDARVYGWGKPVAFGRANAFYDPTTESSVRLDRLLERHLDLPRGAIEETYRDMLAAAGPIPGDVPPEGPLTDLLVDAVRALDLRTDDGVRLEPTSGRLFTDVLFDDGRRQRVVAFVIDGGDGQRAFLGDEQFLCVDAVVGPFPEDGFDEQRDIEVDECVLHMRGRELRFARIQIEGTPEEIHVQACLPLSIAHPALVAGVIEEVAIIADLVEEETYGHDRE